MQEHLAALAEPSTLDELGIGQVRDVFSNLFFPGTSTLWRRARYLLFVPWIYRDLELYGTKQLNGFDAARRLQARLIRAQKQSDDHEGLIGRFKDEPVRMPDELIWNGLLAWGIRRRRGSLGKYQRMLERGDVGRFELVRGDLGEALEAESGSWWHDALPPRPDDLFDWADFELSWDEAAFLRARLEATRGESFMAILLDDPDPGDLAADWLWEANGVIGQLNHETKEAVDHARVFSYGVQGAGILYSHLVAVAREASDLADRLASDLDQWSGRLKSDGVRPAISAWRDRRGAFWELVTRRNPGLRAGTAEFIDSWMALSSDTPSDLLKNHDAHELIRGREWTVKRHLARLSNKAALDQARAEAGTGQLDFRWSQASSLATDIHAALAGEEH